VFEDEFFEKINNKKRDIYSIWARSYLVFEYDNFLFSLFKFYV
jgi:hypothetical protein